MEKKTAKTREELVEENADVLLKRLMEEESPKKQDSDYKDKD